MISLVVAFLTAFTIDLWSQLGVLFSQPQTWALILSLLTPFAIAVIKQPAIPDKYVRPIAWAFSGLIGLLTVVLSGQLDPANIITSVPLIVAATEASYRVIWKGTYSLSFLQAFTDVLHGKAIPPRNGPTSSGQKDALYKS